MTITTIRSNVMVGVHGLELRVCLEEVALRTSHRHGWAWDFWAQE